MRDFKYFTNILTHYESIQKLKRGEMCAPRFCTLQTSNRCNQNCMGCSFGHHDIRLNNEIMSFDNHLKILDQLINIGVKGFEFCGGGEPTCLPYLLDCMKYLVDRKCNVGLITNGVFLNNELMEFVINYGTYIRVSMETGCEELYIKYKRCPDNHYTKVVTNLKHLLLLKRKIKSMCDVSLKFDISKTLQGDFHIKQSFKIAKEMNYSTVQFKFLRHEPEELSFMERMYQREILLKKGRELGMGVGVPDVSNNEEVPQCWLNPLHIVVDYLGDVYLCCYYYYREKEHKIGNMLQQSLEDIWYSSQHWEKIKQINKNKCAAVDCKFFEHHHIINKAFINGRENYL